MIKFLQVGEAVEVSNIFTKSFDGKRFYYYFNNKFFRTSKRNFTYGCFATSNITGQSFPISLGSKRLSTLFSMARFYNYYCSLEVLEIHYM